MKLDSFGPLLDKATGTDHENKVKSSLVTSHYWEMVTRFDTKVPGQCLVCSL